MKIATAPSAVVAGVETLYALPDPTLAGGPHRQHVALARDSGAGLCPLRPASLALSYEPTARRRSGPGSRGTGLAVPPPAGPLAAGSVVHVGVPRSAASRDAQTYVEQLYQADAPIALAYTLTQAFLTLVRERRGDDLEAWMAEAIQNGIEALTRFARSLREALDAVKTGLTLPWSNGPVEGHINHLKLLKR